jgi:hypothetical protein
MKTTTTVEWLQLIVQVVVQLLVPGSGLYDLLPCYYYGTLRKGYGASTLCTAYVEYYVKLRFLCFTVLQ